MTESVPFTPVSLSRYLLWPLAAPTHIPTLCMILALVPRASAATRTSAGTIPEVLFGCLAGTVFLMCTLGCFLEHRRRRRGRALHGTVPTKPTPIPPHTLIPFPAISQHGGTFPSFPSDSALVGARLPIPQHIIRPFPVTPSISTDSIPLPSAAASRGDLVVGLQRALLESNRTAQLESEMSVQVDGDALLPSDDSRRDLVVGLQRALLESNRTAHLATGSESVQTNSNIPPPEQSTSSAEQHHTSSSLPNISIPSQLYTVSEQDDVPGSATTSDSVPTLAGAISPYTYRNNDSQRATRPNLNNTEIRLPRKDTARMASPTETNISVPTYSYPPPGESEEIDNYSAIIPSEVSFGDSLLPPEYQSAWGGARGP